MGLNSTYIRGRVYTNILQPTRHCASKTAKKICACAVHHTDIMRLDMGYD